MNTLHFKYAVEIEKTRSITQAAENLYMAQPNLSKAIKELESTLGITIFRRTSKGVIPTEQGMKFLEYAKQIMVQIDNMEALSSFGNSEQNQLKLSVPRAGYIAQAFAGFTAELDISHNMEIYMRETNALQTICDVKEKNYDFGIIRYQTIHEKYFQDFLLEKGIVSEPIWNFEMKALMSSIHPLAERDEIELQPLREMSVELLWGDTGVPYLSPSASLNNAVKKGTDNRRIYIFDRGSIFDILCSVKKSFMLVSPLPEDMCHRYDLVQRKCVFTDNNYKDVLIYSSDHKLTETEFRFIDKIYEVRNRTAFGDCR